MKKQNTLVLCLATVGIVVLIFDGQTALSGIRDGIDICLQTLIPSLFPFFVLTGVLTSALAGQPIPLLAPICRICHMKPGCESLFAIGILGGYPVGAANIENARREGHLTTEEANRYAVFCNNAGPSFLFGVLGHVFPGIKWLIILWLIQIAASVLTGFLLGGRSSTSGTLPKQKHLSVSEAVNHALHNMAGVCGWVVLFRMCLAFLDRWMLRYLPAIVQVLLTGLLELSNGCLRLDRISEPMLRLPIASAMLSLGGISILMQTNAVFPQLQMRRYIAGKFIHLLSSLLLSFTAILLIIGGKSAIGTVIIGFAAVFLLRQFALRKSKKEVAIP